MGDPDVANIRVLGGNQSNSVSIANFPKSKGAWVSCGQQGGTMDTTVIISVLGALLAISEVLAYIQGEVELCISARS